jgi:hypothetical protein
MTEISSLNLAQAAALLKTMPHTLRHLLSPLDPDVLRWRPSANEWCINEIIGYLIENDQHTFASPIRLMLAQEWPELGSWDAQAILASRRDNERSSPELLAEFETRRNEHVSWVAELRPSQLARSGFHPQVGELQVVDFIYEWVYDDCKYLKQILSNIQTAVWPKMGNIRHFAPPR